MSVLHSKTFRNYSDLSKAVPVSISKYSSCGNAIPSSTTSFQTAIIRGKSCAVYSLMTMFSPPRDGCVLSFHIYS